MKLIQFESFEAATGNVFPVRRTNALFFANFWQNAMKKITQRIRASTNYNSEEEWFAAIKRRPLMCWSYKYFEMSHLGKTASNHGRGDKSEPEKNLEKKDGSLVF